MAVKQVSDSQGRLLEIKLVKVDRSLNRVMFEIIDFNSRFIFTVSSGTRIIQDKDRQVINPDVKATLHVSRSVYRAMAAWAASIIHDHRR